MASRKATLVPIAVTCFLFFLFYFFSSSHSQHASSALVACMGDKAAKNSIIYLHGLDIQKGSPDEHRNRAQLLQLAQEHHFRITLPRSTDTCKSRLCWFASSAQQRSRTWAKIGLQAKACGIEPDEAILMGFSNGGYYVNKFFQDCSSQQFRGLAIGAAGRIIPSKNLQKCGKLIVVTGKKESVRSNASKMFEILKTEGKAKIQLIEHPGGHVLPGNSQLVQIIEKLL